LPPIGKLGHLLLLCGEVLILTVGQRLDFELFVMVYHAYSLDSMIVSALIESPLVILILLILILLGSMMIVVMMIVIIFIWRCLVVFDQREGLVDVCEKADSL
jgi:heme/copper-type cytochrome/quinol oxidase subunit 2